MIEIRRADVDRAAEGEPAALHALGWTFSTGILARRLFDSALVVASLVLVRALLLRWLALARRRLAFEQHRKMLERLAAEREAAKDGENRGDEDDAQRAWDLLEADLARGLPGAGTSR
mgnify:CR=1 FL=1